MEYKRKELIDESIQLEVEQKLLLDEMEKVKADTENYLTQASTIKEQMAAY